MSSNSNPISIAFLGATGGCVNAALAHTLKSGVKAVALARNPEKLNGLLLAQGLSQETISDNLEIIEGSSIDVDSIKKIIYPEINDGTPVSMIVSGVGSVPGFQASISRPITADQPTLCEDTAKAVTEALSKNERSKPILVTISAAGVPNGKIVDAPGFLKPFNSYLLSTAHADKAKMEEQYTSNSDLFKTVIIVRPSWLKGDGKINDKNNVGYQKVRAGASNEPAIGYFMSRGDVGEWIYQEIIHAGGEKWFGKKVSLAV